MQLMSFVRPLSRFILTHRDGGPVEPEICNFRRAALDAQLGAGLPSPATSSSPASSVPESPAADAADGAAGKDTLVAAAERAAALDAQHLASQQLQEVKHRQYALHQQLDQLKADVSSLLCLMDAALGHGMLRWSLRRSRQQALSNGWRPAH